MSAAAASDAGPVCITGMHRAGTSLTARLLNLLGVQLGPEDALMPPDAESNPTGFWEHAELTEISDEILAALDGSWRRPPALEPGWEEGPELAELRDRARIALSGAFGDAPLWGWKDPRTALTMRFWQVLIPDLRYVICVRNPRDVAASLAARDGLSALHAHRLWVRHMAAAVAATAERPRIVVAYEDYFSSLPGALARLGAFIGLPERARAEATVQAARGFLEPGLRHHSSESALAIDDPSAPIAVRALYAALMLASRLAPEDISGVAPLDSLARTLLPPGDAARAVPSGAATPLLLRDLT